jgi:hypothetical protein
MSTLLDGRRMVVRSKFTTPSRLLPIYLSPLRAEFASFILGQLNLKLTVSLFYSLLQVPHYFRQTKYKSFQRQLNLWGFGRVRQGPDKGGYAHPSFVRGDRNKCDMITHTSIKGTAMRRPAPSTTDSSCPSTPEDFISDIQDAGIRKDVQELHDMIRWIAPNLIPRTEFKGMLGYGNYQYHYKTGREGEWCKIGISYGKQISLYCCGLADGKHVLDRFADRFRKAKVGLSCLRFQRLGDLDHRTLEELLAATAAAETMA